MLYLDYSANTPVDEEVLQCFCEAERRYPGNANAHHQAGAAAKAAINEATRSIARCLGAPPAGIIYTSGASEANNLAVKGLAALGGAAGRHILSSPLEHSSVSGSLEALQKQGYEVELLDILPDGTVDLADLKKRLRPDTVLVAVTAVDSELGVVQPIAEIAELSRYPKVRINSPANAVPHILNLSVQGVKGTVFQRELDTRGVCVSVKSACSSDGLPSRAVLAVSQDRRNALSSWRISLSHLTTEEEATAFLHAFADCYNTLTQ